MWRGRAIAADKEMTADTGTATVGSGGRLAGMIVAFSVAPTIVGDESAEMSDAVAEAVRVVRASGLPNETNAMFTLIEGEWDEVFAVIKEATDAVRAVSPRTSLVIKADIREGVTGQITQKVESVNRYLEENQ